MLKKFILILILCLWCLINNVQAKLYHGIDIDDIYTKSDWNSKDEIKDIIDDLISKNISFFVEIGA